MKIFKSIKWRLQLWYGLILVFMLAGFGFTAYQLERGRLLGRIDDELHRRIQILANALHRPPPREPDGNRQGQPFDRPPPGQFPEDGPPEQNPRPPREFHLPPEDAGLFDTNNPNNFYFIIEGRDGDELARSDNVPPSEVKFQHRFNAHSLVSNLDNLPAPRASLNFQHNRGIFQRLPSGETIYVACSVIPELRELKITALKLAGVGGIILFFGLAGGWWFVGRALRPISEISSTAVKISAGDLSQRINVAEAESELGQLAAVLNATFARLEAAFAQQQQFTSDAAHELRTPVSVMLTQTQTALNREREAADYKQTVEACQRAAQRMRRLIESLLALARLDAGQEVLKRLRFDFSKTISDCVELVKPMAEERGVKIFTQLSSLEIIGDSERLAQVVTNLLTNAIQYNLPDGELRVKLETQDGVAVLTVSDTGAGISAEDLPRVFERFYRAEKSRSSGHTGLGLAISKAIIEAHSGTIEVCSQFERGTTFVIRLPMTS
ncbi:MAG: ATP-binding protein [Verrucomicrobiota bacterium]|jgi:heavy metal sensor kinase